MGSILVVEDDAVVTELLQEVLHDEGHLVLTALDGLHALEVLACVQIQLIITDIVMPRLDGVAFCRALHTNPATAQIPVILCSAQPEANIVDQCIYAAFLAKPFELDDLLRLVAMHILPEL